MTTVEQLLDPRVREALAQFRPAAPAAATPRRRDRAKDPSTGGTVAAFGRSWVAAPGRGERCRAPSDGPFVQRSARGDATAVPGNVAALLNVAALPATRIEPGSARRYRANQRTVGASAAAMESRTPPKEVRRGPHATAPIRGAQAPARPLVIREPGPRSADYYDDPTMSK